MKKFSAALAIAVMASSAIATIGPHAQGQRPDTRVARAEEPQDKASIWMKQKLVASGKILEGMTRADFEMIEKNAQGMQFLNYLEGWSRADMPEYRAQLHAFEHANGALVRAAMDKNLDKVTIAYTQLTISCVQCHQLIRDKVKD